MNIHALKNKIKPMAILAKATGIVGLGISLYDAHSMGKRMGNKTKSIANANAGYDYFKNTQYSVNASKATSITKKRLFNWELGECIRGRINKRKGYIKGFFNNLGKHIIPFGLSIAALVCKGIPSKISAAGLAIYGAYSFFAHTCSHLN